ncbi:membrane protein insertase YidC [Candidatus Parcubacteria bacterium]|nr:MAG: membrane protein insertase YidC [Candidatus Parcubacteria bacterium]
MVALWNTFIHDPLLNLLILFYNTIAFGDLGVAIILLTVLVRLLLFPLFHKSTRQQVLLQKIQPKINEIKKRHKKNLQKQGEELMALYKEHNISPFAGLGVMVIQIPVLIAIYRIFLNIFKDGALRGLYGFVAAPQTLHHISLGFLDLQQPSYALAVIAAALQYVQLRLLQRSPQGKVDGKAKMVQGMMASIMPLFIFFFLVKLPAALGIYLLTTILFSIIQQEVIRRKLEHDAGLERVRTEDN